MAVKRLAPEQSEESKKLDALIDTLKTKGVITAAEADNAKKGKK